MTASDHSEQTVFSSSEVVLPSLTLCTILGVELNTQFDDLTIRCAAYGDGSATVVDLMFTAIDVQLLRDALADSAISMDAGRAFRDGCLAKSRLLSPRNRLTDQT